MNTFPVSPRIVERVERVLAHPVWQFAALALLAGVIVQAMRNRSQMSGTTCWWLG